MTMTLDDAMKLADQDSPLPSLAGRALKALRDHIAAQTKLLPRSFSDLAARKVDQLRAALNSDACAVVVGTDQEGAVAVVTPLGKVSWFYQRPPQAEDSLTITALIADLRKREAAGRVKYGADVDRPDYTNADWRQHLREELMDALLYSLAEERTAADSVRPMAEPLRPGYVRCQKCDAQMGGYGYGEFPKLCPVCQDAPQPGKHERRFVGPGYLEQTGYIDPQPGEPNIAQESQSND